jgi:hypothetical protein
MPVQVRHTDLRLRDELDDELAFLVPVMMDPKRLKVQVFVKGDKSRHNMICEEISAYALDYIERLKHTASSGAYFKAEAARVGGPLFTPGEVEVGMERWAICDHHPEAQW